MLIRSQDRTKLVDIAGKQFQLKESILIQAILKLYMPIVQ